MNPVHLDRKKAASLGLLLLVAAVCSAALFLFCYQADNKYTRRGLQPEAGLLVLSPEDLQNQPLLHLITGWEFYRGELLAPEDFSPSRRPLPLPDEYLFIGQYGGFEGPKGGQESRSPHGSATYRLNISLPPEPQSYMLELPEIFSAYRLYINGELMAKMGDPNPVSYRAETGNKRIMLRLEDHLEIILAVSDYSHFYSGLIYPPAFGLADQVADMLNTRFGVRMAGITAALIIGLLYLVLWFFLAKGRVTAPNSFLPLVYAALCVLFAIYISYPVVKTFWPGGMGWYALEKFAYAAMLLLMVLIQSRISGVSAKVAQGFMVLGGLVCALSLLIPRIMGSNLSLMVFYSDVLALYTWICAFYLLASAAYGLYKDAVYSRIMLIAATVFAMSLIMYGILPLFEPIRFGLFAEIAGAVLVVSIGIVMAQEVAGQFHMRLVFEKRAETAALMMERQKTYYGVILEKEEQRRKARHDMRHHMMVIQKLAAENNAAAYAGDLLEQLGAIMNEEKFCDNHIVNVVLGHFKELAATEKTALELHPDLPVDTGKIPDMELCVVFANLLENALEACRRLPQGERYIRLRSRTEKNRLIISVINSFDGNWQEKNGLYYSHKKTEAPPREGTGLASVKAISEAHNGFTKVEITPETWKVSVLLHMA